MIAGVTKIGAAVAITARPGKFSSDRTILEYAEQIWHAKPVSIKMLSRDDVKGKFLQ